MEQLKESDRTQIGIAAAVILVAVLFISLLVTFLTRGGQQSTNTVSSPSPSSSTERPSEVCTTDFCKRISIYLKRSRRNINPCTNFYGFCCEHGEAEEFRDRLRGGAVQYFHELRDHLARTGNATPHSSLKFARRLFEKCMIYDAQANAGSVAYEVFMRKLMSLSSKEEVISETLRSGLKHLFHIFVHDHQVHIAFNDDWYREINLSNHGLYANQLRHFMEVTNVHKVNRSDDDDGIVRTGNLMASLNDLIHISRHQDPRELLFGRFHDRNISQIEKDFDLNMTLIIEKVLGRPVEHVRLENLEIDPAALKNFVRSRNAVERLAGLSYLRNFRGFLGSKIDAAFDEYANVRIERHKDESKEHVCTEKVHRLMPILSATLLTLNNSNILRDEGKWNWLIDKFKNGFKAYFGSRRLFPPEVYSILVDRITKVKVIYACPVAYRDMGAVDNHYQLSASANDSLHDLLVKLNEWQFKEQMKENRRSNIWHAGFDILAEKPELFHDLYSIFIPLGFGGQFLENYRNPISIAALGATAASVLFEVWDPIGVTCKPVHHSQSTGGHLEANCSLANIPTNFDETMAAWRSRLALRIHEIKEIDKEHLKWLTSDSHIYYKFIGELGAAAASFSAFKSSTPETFRLINLETTIPPQLFFLAFCASMSATIPDRDLRRIGLYPSTQVERRRGLVARINLPLELLKEFKKAFSCPRSSSASREDARPRQAKRERLLM